jgi:hypothetical protein
VSQPSGDLAQLNLRAKQFHVRRCLNDASVLYQQILAQDRPQEPTAGQFGLAMRFMPRLFVTPGEYFSLKDVVVIIHPERPVLAYHLFWEDDVDFPEDNDPCDHEIVWVELDEMNQRVKAIYAYFHGKILTTSIAAQEANSHNGRAGIAVEWGKHGSLPWDAAGVQTGVTEPLLKQNWEVLHRRGTRLPLHPLARGWPRKFTGDFQAYRDFSILVDPVPLVEGTRLVKVSRWGCATIDQHCLRYNFAPKPDWPWGDGEVKR